VLYVTLFYAEIPNNKYMRALFLYVMICTGNINNSYFLILSTILQLILDWPVHRLKLEGFDRAWKGPEETEGEPQDCIRPNSRHPKQHPPSPSWGPKPPSPLSLFFPIQFNLNLAVVQTKLSMIKPL